MAGNRAGRTQGNKRWTDKMCGKLNEKWLPDVGHYKACNWPITGISAGLYKLQPDLIELPAATALFVLCLCVAVAVCCVKCQTEVQNLSPDVD